MVCCLTAPSHCLNQYWLIISLVLWHSSEGIIMRRSEDTNQLNKIGNSIFRIAFRSPRGKWVKHVTADWWCWGTVYPKKYAHGFCFAVLCCGYTLTDFPISIRLTSLALWQSDDCPSASKATLMNMDKYFIWIHYERLHNHNKAKHNKTVCIFIGLYCNNT